MEPTGMMPLSHRAALGLLLFFPFLTPLAARADPPPAVPPPIPAPAVETPDTLGAVWVPAAPGNFQPSQRPSAALPIDRIVIHDIEGTSGEAIRWFRNPQAQVSSHYVVDGHTGQVTQMVRERDIAWHAGDHVTNFRSIGIEHEGFAYRPGFFNPLEYEASAHLVRAIALRYGIPRDRTHIIGHFEVPDTAHPGHFGGRNGHTDPGPYWDWDYFMALVRDDAALAQGGVPAAPIILHPGEAVPASFVLSNTGDDAWPADPDAASAAALRSAGPVYLGRWEPGTGETVWGGGSAFSGPDWVSPRFAASPAGGDTAPGTSGRFVVMLHAPPAVFGPVSETFRLYKVPPAPRLPVPFGPVLTVSARVVPWEVRADPPAAPPGWAAKTLPGGSRALWRGSAAPSPASPRPVQWQAVLPVAGSWDVSVRWPTGPGRTDRATYAVSGKTFRVDQRRGGGMWHSLGRFRFGGLPAVADVRPGAPVPAPPPVVGAVTLLPGGMSPGVLVAGEVRFVGPY